MTASYHCIDSPFIHVQRHGTQGANRVDDDQAVVCTCDLADLDQIAIAHGIGGFPLYNSDDFGLMDVEMMLKGIYCD